MGELHRVDPTSEGWTRRRAGRGFSYLDSRGDRLSAVQAQRIKDLVIPPAWTDVWICPDPDGHLQAVGTDDAGRRQYLYHPQWRTDRDAEKFDRVLKASRNLARLRRAIAEDLVHADMSLARASALAVRLLDRGYFRIGSDVYADEHGSFGLTTLLREHLTSRGGALVFSFPGKSGVQHTVTIDDPSVIETLDILRRRRSGVELLAYKEGGRWVDLTAEHVNTYLSEHFGGEFTAKDFRTWHATVIAALGIAASKEEGASEASRKRAVRAAIVEASEYLGNTPAVARNSYIDPRLWDAYEAGLKIPVPRSKDPDRRQELTERAVRRLLAASR